ncbi:hypothetical protein BJY01DRAFT_29589 [Aspergillus pseudoustus]|uniref:Uncharacterized protein n=1 Tax=Aspergillus pseudoustus TaxID=1810923 RepID=A0ABR4JJC0_9EURO
MLPKLWPTQTIPPHHPTSPTTFSVIALLVIDLALFEWRFSTIFRPFFLDWRHLICDRSRLGITG